ncbi:Fe(3+)-hydroxamate ABC transporter substrate-binding protein FhuD [Yersinia pseudotuberculosis]|nr:Fe(3+)-hydroxamate ABC transporter substrate-binding protein FhuD [Yersinia pseudotuberculosis]MBP0070053.1 Fe(3+)-hydroxamate ABC transporter substrate-binding protein FhuD [Yersinia pseudotuberculosis]
MKTHLPMDLSSSSAPNYSSDPACSARSDRSSRPDYYRRRLLMALTLSPLLLSLPSLVAAAPKSDQPLLNIDRVIDIQRDIDTKRVVALEWLPVELLLALGVTPFGVADIHNYRLWVGEPALPADVINVGQRTEPNLELLQQMAPSLILLSQGYGPSPEKLAPIAPTMSFAFNEQGSSPLAVGKNSLQTLGQRLGLETAAQQHLADFDHFMLAARARLSGDTQTPLLMFSLLDPRHALIIGNGSLFQDVLSTLNIENAWQGETNFWGSAVVGIERLATIKTARAVCFGHGNNEMLQQVARTPLWQSLSFVRENQLRLLPPVWFYGATLSAMRFVRLLEQAWGKAP